MTTSANNPFVLPGFGQSGDVGQNPLLASMEMMRQAWQGLSGAGVLAQPSVANPLTVEELDRRIADLRAVENWLHMNTAMLSSSIQALEVQRATIATIKSFMPVPGASTDDNPSPLEVALGIKPAGQAKIKKAPHNEGADAQAAKEPAAAAAGAAMAGADAAQNWWNMLQEQFNVLAAATAASMPSAPSAAANPQPAAKRAPAKRTAAKRAPAKRAARKSAAPRKGAA